MFIVLLLGVAFGFSNSFSSCAKLTSVELMNGLVGLGSLMFVNSGLMSVIIPSTITSYGHQSINIFMKFQNNLFF